MRFHHQDKISCTTPLALASFLVVEFKRREFLIGTAASAAGLLVASTFAACTHGPPADFARFTMFNAAQAWTLDALLEQILPASPGMPSAREAHVIAYFDRELQKPELKQLASAIKYGAEVLIHAAKRAGKENFAELTSDQQQGMIRDFSTNQLHMGKEDTTPVFEHLLAFTIEGYLCDPKYGGNFECKGWKAVGFSASCDHG